MRRDDRQDSERGILVVLFAALLSACASPTGGPAELIGTWRFAGTSAPVPDACTTATVTFHRDGTFESHSGTLKTRGRYSATALKDDYRLKLDQLEYDGVENCQGVTASDMRAQTVNVLDLVFERAGRGLRLAVPKSRGAYVAYTRAD